MMRDALYGFLAAGNFKKNREIITGQTHVKTLSDKITESVKF